MSTNIKPNYRIYDRTGGGVTENIHADSLEDAIEQGRSWIEDGDWSGDREDQDGGKTYRTILLDCCVREIVRRPDLSSLEAALPEYPIEREDGIIYIDHHPDDGETPADIAAKLSDVAAVSAPGERGEDGYMRLVLTPVGPLPSVIDEEATDEGQSSDCSGKYSDALPECAADGGGEHDWQSDYDVVGGIRENPGVWSTGGTGMGFDYCCAKCGCYKHEHQPGVQRNPDEPLQTITIKPRDEKSEAWLREKHAEDGWLPAWLAEYLDCPPTVRMTVEQARAYVAGHSDDDTLDDDDLEHAFSALYHRRADDQDRTEGLWSHLCAAVTP